MADKTQPIASGIYFTVSVTFDDVTGAISSLDWTILSGTLTVTIHRSGQPDLTRTVNADGGIAVPAGYDMTQTPKGSWAWQGPISFAMSWSSA